ncbi:hypothetical protein NQ314_007737 [Rhamnusium bicolor]|uniref:Uncharacterized protein n=1 Tax=Rhamnusium bicolor TaxID=1586634 RepID=A0AAV8YHQ3_9CUCU|nr:hypothetical protein NQ314_007737 [Rhamnusium bicolor]
MDLGKTATGGDHVISLIDEISFQFPPSPPLSQLEDIEPEQFCNGDNRPIECGQNCMCTHMVDIPYNAIVEVVLVDEGKKNGGRNRYLIILMRTSIEEHNDYISIRYPHVNSNLDTTICIKKISCRS